jgi:hypothetical protein
VVSARNEKSLKRLHKKDGGAIESIGFGVRLNIPVQRSAKAILIFTLKLSLGRRDFGGVSWVLVAQVLYEGLS